MYPWAPSLLGVAVPVVLVAVYVWLMMLARRRGTRWPVWRLMMWTAACIVMLWVLIGPPWALRTTNTWLIGIGVGAISAVAPLGFALGDPVRLTEIVRGRPFRAVRGRIARFVMFPGVASAISAGFLTGTLMSRPSITDLAGSAAWPWILLGALLTGCLVSLPLLSDDLLPPWATPAVKTVIAFADGIFDALPAVAVMLLINQEAGGGLLAVAESIGIPMIAATVVMWVRADGVEAEVVDAQLDAEPEAGLWWESDPRFADRFTEPD